MEESRLSGVGKGNGCMKLRPDEREYHEYILRAWKGSTRERKWSVSIRPALQGSANLPVSSTWYCQCGTQAKAFQFGCDVIDVCYASEAWGRTMKK